MWEPKPVEKNSSLHWGNDKENQLALEPFGRLTVNSVNDLDPMQSF
jgi:hypothetical protein